MSKEVISIKIRKGLKEEVKRLGIDIGRVVEEALEEEICRAKMEGFRMLLDKGMKAIDLSIEEWVNVVRESRLDR